MEIPARFDILRRLSTAACLLLITGGLLAGCASRGKMPTLHETHVSLGSDNFKLLRPNAQGESVGISLFGLIPITSPSFSEARSSLYRSAGESLQGRSIALASMSQEESTVFLLLVSMRRITLSADIVEFHE